MPRKKKETPPPVVAPGHRPPGDRRPIGEQKPLEKKQVVLRRPGGGIAMKAAEEARAKAAEEARKKAEAGIVETPQEPFFERFVYVPDYRAAPGHELYMTPDFNGRLRTHTAYKSTGFTKPVVPGMGKRKIQKKDENETT